MRVRGPTPPTPASPPAPPGPTTGTGTRAGVTVDEPAAAGGAVVAPASGVPTPGPVVRRSNSRTVRVSAGENVSVRVPSEHSIGSPASSSRLVDQARSTVHASPPDSVAVAPRPALS